MESETSCYAFWEDFQKYLVGYNKQGTTVQDVGKKGIFNPFAVH